jgi:hypothetical protein
MSQDIDLQHIRRRAFRETMVDGLTDLFLGLYLILVSGVLKTSTAGLVVFVWVLFIPLLRYLKKRFTYPRLGYVELADSQPPAPWGLILVFAGLAFAVTILALVVSGDIREARQWYGWMPLLLGILFLGVMAVVAIGSGLGRYYFYGVLSAGNGIAISFLHFEGRMDAISLYLLAVGLPIAVCGALVFALFPLRNPVRSLETPGG